jgi:hypothetical protein
MIPQTFEQWHHCITIACKIQLSLTFIEQRLAVLTDDSNAETQNFTALYGREHLANIILWFTIAKTKW